MGLMITGKRNLSEDVSASSIMISNPGQLEIRVKSS